jgi:hypothetical protein
VLQADEVVAVEIEKLSSALIRSNLFLGDFDPNPFRILIA